MQTKPLGSLKGLQENKALKGIGVQSSCKAPAKGARWGAQHPLRCRPNAVPAHPPARATTLVPPAQLKPSDLAASQTSTHRRWAPAPPALILPRVPPGCSQASTSVPPTPVPVPITPITNFSPPGWVSQLFGFVYACYVSKVFLEEEDSCKCFRHQSRGDSRSAAKWPRVTPAGASPGMGERCWDAGEGIPLVGVFAPLFHPR